MDRWTHSYISYLACLVSYFSLASIIRNTQYYVLHYQAKEVVEK